ncbi:MAG: hypothetical protein ABW252_04255 [Polyangiales bacterium]
MPGRASELLSVALLALSVCVAPCVARAHAPLPRALSVARDGASVALSLPGFGMLVRGEEGQPFAYACDALLGIPLAIDPPALARRDDGVLLIGTSAGLRAMTPDGCPHALAEALPAAPVHALAIAGDVVYAVAGQGLWRSADLGEHWQPRAPFVGGERVAGMRVDPRDDARLYVSRASALLVFDGAGSALATFAQERALTLLHAEASGRLWAMRASAVQQGNRGFEIVRAESAAGPWRVVHTVRYFGGLAVDADGTVWVGDEGGGLFRSDDGEVFRAVAPDLSTACIAAGADALWVGTSVSTLEEALLTRIDAADQPATAARYLEADRMVTCDVDVARVCAPAWVEWQRDVLMRGADAGVTVAADTEASARDGGTDATESVLVAPDSQRAAEIDEAGCALAPRGGFAWAWLLAVLALRTRRRR